jgi:hypothetical protein
VSAMNATLNKNRTMAVFIYWQVGGILLMLLLPCPAPPA